MQLTDQEVADLFVSAGLKRSQFHRFRGSQLRLGLGSGHTSALNSARKKRQSFRFHIFEAKRG
jgi:hypothetical protein